MTTHAQEDVVVLRPQGELCEGEECDEMERRLHELVSRGGRVVVDLSSTRFLTAHGLGVLGRTLQVAAEHGGRLVLCGATGLERWLLDVTHMTEALRVYPTEAEALRELRAERAVA